jgi:hypothetical protein
VPVKAESRSKIDGGRRPDNMAPQELYYDIGNLTGDDTDQLASLASWRARLFGNTKRLRKQVPRLLSLSRPGIFGSRFCPVFWGLSLHFLEGFLR